MSSDTKNPASIMIFCHLSFRKFLHYGVCLPPPGRFELRWQKNLFHTFICCCSLRNRIHVIVYCRLVIYITPIILEKLSKWIAGPYGDTAYGGRGPPSSTHYSLILLYCLNKLCCRPETSKRLHRTNFQRHRPYVTDNVGRNNPRIAL